MPEVLEAECRFEDARAALTQAVGLFPEFERLERTWLLTGKLDHAAPRPPCQKELGDAVGVPIARRPASAVSHGRC